MNIKRILVVDDEPSVTRNLKLNLESGGGYEVFGENPATDALTAARNVRPDLILLDVMMPGMEAATWPHGFGPIRCSATHPSSF